MISIRRRTIRIYGHREHSLHRGYWSGKWGPNMGPDLPRGRSDIGQRWYCRIRIVRVQS